MRKIAVVGCGGINSWVVKYIDEIAKIFEHDKLIYVKLFDKDIVEEKNLLRNNQNFLVDDLLQEKAEILGKRYNYEYENVWITEKNLKVLERFDDVILGVDNNKARRLIYEYCLKNNKYLLDLRAQGSQIAFYVLDNKKTMEFYDKLLFSNKEVNERKGSCQLTSDIENDTIQNGNKIIAHWGIYGIYLKHLRGEELASNEFKRVY